MKTAAIILNRNLPEETDRLASSLLNHESDLVDVYVVESGSDPDKLSRFCSFYADWPSALRDGLRYPAGMNYGLYNILKDNPNSYDSFLLLSNDTNFLTTLPIHKLRTELFRHSSIGLVSPCGDNWGEQHLIPPDSSKSFWYIHNNCYLLSSSLVSCLSVGKSSYRNFLFDCSNYRGYATESELISKAYLNGFMSIITTSVFSREDESLLRDRFSLIKTLPAEANFQLYIQEGLDWMYHKYGFTSRWDMNNYALTAYNQFFDANPQLRSSYYLLD